jgi:SAM-dependent methyltransferase
MTDESIFDPHEREISGLFVTALNQGKNEKQTTNEAEYIRLLLRLEPPTNGQSPAHILDVPCGNGRIALALAEKGFKVTGVDLTADLLAVARQQAAGRQLEERVTWKEGDMRDLPWTGVFDGAFCFWESFGYFDDAGNMAFLKAVANTLKPGSRFVLDTHVSETLLPTLGMRDWRPVLDMIVCEERVYDVHTGITTRHFVFCTPGKIEHKLLDIRIYPYRDLVKILLEAGFGEFESYDALSFDAFGMGATRLVIMGRKMV